MHKLAVKNLFDARNFRHLFIETNLHISAMLLTFMALGTTVDKIFNTKETFPST